MSGLKRYGLLLTAVLLTAAAIAQSEDDTLTLINGEILRGELVDIGDGVITFRTRHGSRTFLPADQVQNAETDAYRSVHAKDENQATGRVSIKDGNVFVLSGDGLITFAIADVAGLAAVDSSSIENGGAHSWSSNVESGVLFREGNRSSVDLYARIELDRDSSWYRWNWTALFALDESDGFPNYVRTEFDWRGGGYDWGSPFVLLAVERDRDAAIDARASAVAGIERRLFDRPRQQVRGGVGLGAVYESFDAKSMFGSGKTDELRWRVRAQEFTDSTTTRDSDLEILVRVIYEARLRDRLTYRDELRVMPSLIDLGEIRASYDSGLVWSLLDGLELNLQLRIDYDDDPPFAELDRWRAAVGAGLRVSFGAR